MGKYIKNADRNQIKLLPRTVDEYVDENSEARVIDAFVDTLDMEELGFKRSKPNKRGTNSYDPRDLLKLYIYSYINKIRSSRRIMKETRRNLEVIWLINEIKPDFRTISDFRKEHVKELKKVFKEFNKMCVELNLFSMELLSGDGSKFKAVNSKANNYTLNKINDLLDRLDKRITEYMEELNTADQEEEQLIIKNKIKDAKGRVIEYRKLQKEMKEKGLSQISTIDKESKLMKCNGNMLVGFNVQTGIDSKNHLGCSFEVTDKCNDNGLIYELAKEEKEMLGVEQIEQLVDGGYKNLEDIKKCLENRIIPILPDDEYAIEYDYEEGEVSEEERKGERPEDIIKCFKHGIKPECYKDLDMGLCISTVTVKEEKEEEEQKEYKEVEEIKKRAKEINGFVRDINNNIVYCREGERLTHKSFNQGRERYCNKLGCKRCKNKCTEASYKTVDFKEREVEKGLKRTYTKRKVIGSKKIVTLFYRPDKEKYQQRKCLSEHPFGTIKRGMGADHFLLKGKEKVSGEFALMFLSYNIKRVINIIGVEELVKYMKKIKNKDKNKEKIDIQNNKLMLKWI